MRAITFITSLLGVLAVAADSQQPAAVSLADVPPGFIVGADVSFLGDLESKGVVFNDEGESHPGFEILRHHGYNWVRLRIMNEPTPLPNTLAYTLAEAKAAKGMGFRLLLDFHYSDDWADPAHEKTPRRGPSYRTMNSSRQSSTSRAIRSPHFASRERCPTWCRSAMKSPAG